MINRASLGTSRKLHGDTAQALAVSSVRCRVRLQQARLGVIPERVGIAHIALKRVA